MFTLLFSLTNSLYTLKGVYCVIYPSLRGNIKEFDFSIPLLRMISCIVYSFLGTIDTVLHCSLNTENIMSVHYIALYSKLVLYSITVHCTIYNIHFFWTQHSLEWPLGMRHFEASSQSQGNLICCRSEDILGLGQAFHKNSLISWNHYVFSFLFLFNI